MFARQFLAIVAAAVVAATATTAVAKPATVPLYVLTVMVNAGGYVNEFKSIPRPLGECYAMGEALTVNGGFDCRQVGH